MESNRNNISLSNEDFEELSRMIEGHLSYLFHHYSYISKIENRQIDQDKIDEYLYDVYNFKFEKDKFYTHTLPELKDTVKVRLDIYIVLMQATKISDQAQAICLLKLLLERESNFEKMDKKLTKGKNVKKKDRIQTAFHDYPFTNSLHAKVQKLLPDCYPELAKVFKIEEKISVDLKYHYDSFPVVDWGSLRAKIKLDQIALLKTILGDKQGTQVIENVKNDCKEATILSSIHEAINEQFKQNLSSNLLKNIENESGEASTNIKKLESILNERAEKNSKEKDMTEHRKGNVLAANIATFFEIHPLTRSVLNFYSNFKNITEQTKLRTQQIEQASSEVKKRREKLTKQQKKLLSKATSTKANASDEDERIKELAKGIDVCKEDTLKIYNDIKDIQWPSQGQEDVNTEEQFKEILSDVKDNCSEIEAKLNELEHALSFYAEKIAIRKDELAKAKKSKQEEIENKNSEELNKLKKQNEEFIVQRQLKSAKYNEDVARKRKERAQVKANAVNQAKNQKQTQNNNSKDQIVQYKNVVMDELLNKLSTNNLILLKSILNLQKGVTYDDVCNLVTNHLGGKIVEIGNGSSHKRIQLDKYIIEMVTNTDVDNDAEVISDFASNTDNEVEIGSGVVSGGFFRPHGKARTVRTLSPFNLELVQKTFIKANITLNIIESLEQQKNIRPMI